MQSYLKAAALASVAITLHGCGDEEKKPVQLHSANDFLAKLDADKIQGAVKVQAQQFLKKAQFKAAASEMIAAASAAAAEHGNVDKIVGEAMSKLDSVEGCANQAVREAVEHLSSELEKLNIPSGANIDTKAHEAFNYAMGEGKKAVMEQLKALDVNEKKIANVAQELEDRIKQMTGIEIHSHNAVASGLQLLGQVVAQGKGYENQVNDMVRHINVADHLASAQQALPIHGENFESIEKKIQDAIRDGADKVQDGLRFAQNKAERIMRDRKDYVESAQRMVDKAQQAVNQVAK